MCSCIYGLLSLYYRRSGQGKLIDNGGNGTLWIRGVFKSNFSSSSSLLSSSVSSTSVAPKTSAESSSWVGKRQKKKRQEEEGEVADSSTHPICDIKISAAGADYFKVKQILRTQIYRFCICSKRNMADMNHATLVSY